MQFVCLTLKKVVQVHKLSAFFSLKRSINSYTSDEATKKVIHVLQGLLDSDVLQTCIILCVYFILCTTIQQPKYREKANSLGRRPTV